MNAMFHHFKNFDGTHNTDELVQLYDDWGKRLLEDKVAKGLGKGDVEVVSRLKSKID